MGGVSDTSSDTLHEGEADPLITLFRACVVRVDDGHGTFRGTGFFVSPGTVLTCAHVVHGVASLSVAWEGTTFPASVRQAVPPLSTVANAATYPLPDLAVLSIEDAEAVVGHPCVRLAGGGPPAMGEALYLAGYTTEHDPDQAGFTGASAELESPVTEGGVTFHKLKGAQVLGGFSGSPLLSLESFEVQGVVESTRDRRSDLGGFAVAVPTVAEHLVDVTAANAAFHRTDPRWAHAGGAQREAVATRAGLRDRLALLRPTVGVEWSAERSVADLLRPRHTVVDYVGREQLLAEIESWCERPEALAVWFVTGRGGFGKTRLAVEACRGAQRRGWTSGLLAPEATPADIDGLLAWPGRLLVAVDYAETRPDTLARLLVGASTRRSALRVMALVRRPSSRRQLVAEFNPRGDEGLANLLHRAALSLVEESEVDRLELFDRGVADFGPLVGPADTRRRRPALRADHFARPLYVLVAALLVAADPNVDVDALDEADLLRKLVDDHEAHHWQRWADRRALALDPLDQQVAVALATLMGAADEAEALAVVGLIPHISDDAERRMAIARWLALLYPTSLPGDGLRLGPLEPDRLGEVVIADVLRARPELLGRALKAASDAQAARLLTVVERIAREDSAVRNQLRDALDADLGDLLVRGFETSGELLVAVIVAMRLSRPIAGAVDASLRFGGGTLPVWVRPIAAEVTALGVHGLRVRVESDAEALPDLAKSLNHLAIHLAEAGRRDEALGPAEEAVRLYQELVEANAAAYTPDVAMSLNNLSVRLAEAGRREEALGPAQEAVRLYRELAEANAAAYTPNLAAALDTLANGLSQAGRWEEALGPAQEAVRLYRELARANAAAYTPDLANSLNNLASHLAEAGRREEGDAVFTAALDDIGDDPLRLGHLCLARGRWRVRNRQDAEAISDLRGAVAAFQDADERQGRGQARIALRELCAIDPDGFNRIWASGPDPLPAWLRHPTQDDQLVATIIEWVSAPDWDTSRHYLLGHDAELVTEEAEANLEHLIDLNPYTPRLAEDLELLGAARADGIEAAYEVHAQRRLLARQLEILGAWLATPSWDLSQQLAEQHKDELLSDEAEQLLRTIAEEDLGDNDLRLHRGLLELARSDGISVAYALRISRPSILAQLDGGGGGPERLLALARLHSGSNPGEAEAHFRLVCAALDAGELQEATVALAECAQNVPQFERRDFLRRLEFLASERPDLAPTIGGFKPLLHSG